MSRYGKCLLFLATLTAAAGCDESDFVDVPEQGEIVTQAVTAMLTPLFEGAATVPAQPASVLGLQAAPFSYETTISDSRACSSGGQVVREGYAFVNGDDETNETSVLRSTTLEFQTCSVQSGGITTTISSSPSTLGSLVFTVDFVNDEPTNLWGTVTNNPTITAPGYEETCSIMADFQSTAISSSSVTLQVVEGSACGEDLTGETLVVPL